MATIRKNMCDRCGKEIKYVGWTAILKNVFRGKPGKKNKRIDVLQIYDGNPSGYDYTEYSCELCAECTEKLTDFLHGIDEVVKCMR